MSQLQNKYNFSHFACQIRETCKIAELWFPRNKFENHWSRAWSRPGILKSVLPPPEFSSIPNQTHLSMLIRVFKIIRTSQVGEVDQGWKTVQQMCPPGKDLRNPGLDSRVISHMVLTARVIGSEWPSCSTKLADVSCASWDGWECRRITFSRYYRPPRFEQASCARTSCPSPLSALRQQSIDTNEMYL